VSTGRFPFVTIVSPPLQTFHKELVARIGAIDFGASTFFKKVTFFHIARRRTFLPFPQLLKEQGRKP
jgi:hypothetical protein